MAVHVLSESLRHQCTSCGGSCQGVFIPLVDEPEAERVRRMGQKLGVPDPVDSKRRLRRVKGACAFLRDDDLCAIHATFGMGAKPVVCRQYPMVATRVGDDVRVGVDPGCYSHSQSWRAGPAVSAQGLVATPVDLPAAEAAFEARLLDLLQSDDMTVARLASILGGEPLGPSGLPSAFIGRCVIAASAPILRERASDDRAGRLFRRELLAVLEHTAHLDPRALPPWPALDAEGEAFALDALSRLVFLRLAHQIPAVAGVAALGVMGVVLCAWAAPDRAAFGTHSAAWFRAMRSPLFWGALLPEGQSLAALLHGAPPTRRSGG